MSIDPVSLAITAALNAASMALTMSKTIEGPRLSDLSASVADYGTPLNYIHGQRRVEAPCFYCEPIKELKKKRKTKGGKYNEYTYFGTWASLVADHEVQSIDKVWFDRHAVYDAIGGNVFTGDVAEGYEMASYMRFYLGTETQAADERMTATVEAEEGVGTCPAYLGVAYIFFEDTPLEKLGNRFPQVTVVATADSWIERPITYETQLLDLGTVTGDLVFTRDYRYFAVKAATPATVRFIDNANFTLLATATPSVDPKVGAGIGALNDDATLFYNTDYYDQTGVMSVNRAGTSAYLYGPFTRFEKFESIYRFDVPGYGIVMYTAEGEVYDFDDDYHVSYDEGATWLTFDINLYIHSFFQDTYGNVWASGIASQTSATISSMTFVKILTAAGDTSSGPDTVAVTGLVSGNLRTPHACFYKNGDVERFAFCWDDGRLYLADRFTGEVINTTTISNWPQNIAQEAMNAKLPEAKTLWCNFKEYSLYDLSLVRQVNPADWGYGTTLSYSNTVHAVYDPYNNALISTGHSGNQNQMIWRFLERRQFGTTLGSICEAVALRAGMETDDFDFSALDQTVWGYSWTQGAARDIIGPLLPIYDSEIRPHDFQLEGIKRGADPSGSTIETEWLVRADEPLYVVTTIGDTDLPRRIFGVFADLDGDQQPNTAVAQRNAVSVATVRETTYDVSTLAMYADEAQENIERRLRREWMGSVTVRFTATPRELSLEPGDVRDMVLDGVSLRCSLRQMTLRANREIVTEWERDGASVNVVVSSPGAVANGFVPSEVYAPVRTEGFVLDIPLISDAHDQTTPFLYLAAGPLTAGTWPGADVWHSDSGSSESYASGWDGFGADQEATWGVITGALGDCDPNIMDEGSEIIVTLPSGTLESVTQAYLDANDDANLALIGDEIVQFRDAVLQSDGEYLLSGFVRGCRGTEQYVGMHLDGERFLLLNSFVKRHDVGASEIGDTDYYKVETATFNIATTTEQVVAFTAAANRPYAPTHLELTKEDSGDWTIDWVRRTRIGAATLNGQDVPLGEVSESYRVKIIDGVSGTTIRTIEVTSATATYTVAQQTTDWGSEQMTLSVEIVQMSPTLGIEGFPATATA